jgi:hypothetical protein
MKKFFMLPVLLLGLVSGNVECGQGNENSIRQLGYRKFCGNASDAVYTVVQLSMLGLKDSNWLAEGTFSTVVNAVRICRDCFKQKKNKEYHGIIMPIVEEPTDHFGTVFQMRRS